MADPAPVPLVSLLVEVDAPRRPQARRHAHGWRDLTFNTVAGQRRVDDRSNEVTIPELLELLALEGCIVTMGRVPSGWGCQKRIAEAIRDRGADYVLTLKGNQPPWHDVAVGR